MSPEQKTKQEIFTQIKTGGNFAVEVTAQGETIIVQDPLTPREILEHGEQVTRLENIDILKIVRDENTIIDKPHAKKMGESLIQDGQQNTILVRARFNKKGEIVYDIADGFHRYDGACETNGKIKFLRAVVKYNFSDQWLNDQRVMAVNSVRDIQFARKITWMTNSYKESKWYKEKNLSITQIFCLALQNRSGKIFKLSLSEAEEAKEWAKEKCITWNTTITTLYQVFLAVENSDPELVKVVRFGHGGGYGKKGIFNEYRFKETVRCLPKMYKLQWLIHDLVIGFDLVTTEIPVVASAILKSKDNKESLEMIKHNPRDTDVIHSILGVEAGIINGKITLLEPEKNVTNQEGEDSGEEVEESDNSEMPIDSELSKLASIEETVQAAAKDELFDNLNPEKIRKIDENTGEDDLETGGEDPEVEPIIEEVSLDTLPESVVDERSNMGNLTNSENIKAKGKLPHTQEFFDDYNKPKTPKDYENQIATLKQELDLANEQSVKGSKKSLPWWRTLADLTQQEREIMQTIENFRKNGSDINTVDSKLKKMFNLSDKQLWQTKKSAISKYRVFLSNIIENIYNEIV